MGDDPVQAKFECKDVHPRRNSWAVHISPHNSGTAVDSEISSINAKTELNKKSTMGFPTGHQLSRASLLTSPKWGSDTQICCFLQKFQPKTIKSLVQSFIV